MTVRIAWDPNLPVVTSTPFTIGARAFADGAPFPWRELGVAESTVANMWDSRMVHHPVSVPATVPVAESTQEMPGVASTESAAKLTRAERKHHGRAAR